MTFTSFLQHKQTMIFEINNKIQFRCYDVLPIATSKQSRVVIIIISSKAVVSKVRERNFHNPYVGRLSMLPDSSLSSPSLSVSISL